MINHSPQPAAASVSLLGEPRLDRWQQALNRYCRSLTQSHWEADDLAQDVWVKALDQLQAASHANPEALLLRIAKTTWIDAGRRRTALTHILKRMQDAAEGTVPPRSDGLEIESAFQSIIRRLSKPQRSVFMLREVFGCSAAETAERLGTTEGAVKALLHRARQALAAVRKDLEAGGLPLPETERERALLGELTAAYQRGDISAVLELLQTLDNDLTPVMGLRTIPSAKQAKALARGAYPNSLYLAA